MSETEELAERITAIVHEALSPLLTDTLGMEHGWDAAEGVADALIQSSAVFPHAAKLEAVLAIHRQQGDSYKTCSHCVRPSGYSNRSEQPVAWPCPTIAAMDAAHS